MILSFFHSTIMNNNKDKWDQFFDTTKNGSHIYYKCKICGKSDIMYNRRRYHLRIRHPKIYNERRYLLYIPNLEASAEKELTPYTMNFENKLIEDPRGKLFLKKDVISFLKKHGSIEKCPNCGSTEYYGEINGTYRTCPDCGHEEE